jgi:hypothetical protein
MVVLSLISRNARDFILMSGRDGVFSMSNAPQNQFAGGKSAAKPESQARRVPEARVALESAIDQYAR